MTNPIIDAFPDPLHIPHFIFHGTVTEHKYKTIHAFLQHCTTISHICYINCAHIPLHLHVPHVQEQVFTFAQIRSSMPRLIVFDHASFLTIDAQAILRRYIEHFASTVRFVFIVSSISQSGIINPILSRVYNMHIMEPPPNAAPISNPTAVPAPKLELAYGGEYGDTIHEQYDWINQAVQSGACPLDLLPYIPVSVRLQLIQAQWRIDALYFMHMVGLLASASAAFNWKGIVGKGEDDGVDDGDDGTKEENSCI